MDSYSRQMSLPLRIIAVPGECLTTEEQVSHEASGTSTFPFAVASPEQTSEAGVEGS